MIKLEEALGPSGWETSRFIEGRTTPKDERLLRELADAIAEGPSTTSSHSPQLTVLAGLTGLAALVESGCAILGPQIVYDKGAPGIISEWQDMYNAARQQRNSPHPGIDIDGAIGHPVLAPADGEVIDVYFHNTGGNIIRIYHGQNKQGLHLITAYAHLHEQLTKAGQKVKRGDVIGTIGMTGSSITPGYPHLHFILIERAERHKEGWREDPKKYFPRLNFATKDEKILLECFVPGKTYNFPDITFTYPVKCGK